MFLLYSAKREIVQDEKIANEIEITIYDVDIAKSFYLKISNCVNRINKFCIP
jgi:hypothetical protein